MPSIEYHLYRIKFIKPSQLPLFVDDLKPADIFLKAVNEKPSVDLRRNNVWHIGNIQLFDDFNGSFAIGRTTLTTVEKFDDQSGDFVEEIDDSGPYTNVLFDRSIGLLGIAKKLKVAPDVKAISRKIERLLKQTEIVKNMDVDIYVDMIPDPHDFILKIKNAYAIKRFKAWFTGPNPIDADEIFEKPLSVYCQKMNGKSGAVEIVGENLNEDTIEAVAKKTAATGNFASAKIQVRKGGKPVPITLKGDAVKVIVDGETTKEAALGQLKESYISVRE